MSSTKVILIGLVFLFGIILVSCEDVLGENEAKEHDLGQKRLRDFYVLNQLRQIKNLRNNIAKVLTSEEADEIEASVYDLNEEREKKSVMLPRIGRSPIVYPRIGGEKKRAVFQPRVGRNYDWFDSGEEDNSVIVEQKRVPFKPRIG